MLDNDAVLQALKAALELMDPAIHEGWEIRVGEVEDPHVGPACSIVVRGFGVGAAIAVDAGVLDQPAVLAANIEDAILIGETERQKLPGVPGA